MTQGEIMETAETKTFNTTPAETEKTVATRKRKAKKAIDKKFSSIARIQIEYIPQDQLVPNDYNPNRQSDEEFAMLCGSMVDDGFTQPIVIRSEANDGCHTIIDGEHRWRAARVLYSGDFDGVKRPDFWEIPVVKMEVEQVQAMLSTLRHNKARGSHDIELDVEVFRMAEELGVLDIMTDGLGIDDDEMQKMLDDIEPPESLASDEFGEAWVPETTGELDNRMAEDGTGESVEGDVQTMAATPGGIDALRGREKRIAEAKTKEEKEMARKSSDVFRLHLVFGGDEAETVKKVLGGRPADRILEMCREALDEDTGGGGQ